MGVSSRLERGRFDGGPCWLDVEASALPTSVAVMAPALTEGGPPKLDKLLPPLTAGGFLTAKQALQVKILISYYILCYFPLGTFYFTKNHLKSAKIGHFQKAYC